MSRVSRLNFWGLIGRKHSSWPASLMTEAGQLQSNTGSDHVNVFSASEDCTIRPESSLGMVALLSSTFAVEVSKSAPTVEKRRSPTLASRETGIHPIAQQGQSPGGTRPKSQNRPHVLEDCKFVDFRRQSQRPGTRSLRRIPNSLSASARRGSMAAVTEF